MGRGGRSDMQQRNNQPLRKKIMDSEDSDEDYVAEVDEVDEQSDDLDSLVGDASEEESFLENEKEVEEEEEEEEEEDDDEEGGRKGGWRTVVKPKPKSKPKPKPRVQKGSSRSRKNGVNRRKKRRKVTRDDDATSDDDDDDDEFTPEEFEYLKEEEEDDEDEDEDEYEEEEEDYDVDEEDYVDEEEEEEEEEFSKAKTKTKKRGRTTLKRKSSVKGRRKRRAKTVRKTSKKRSKRTSSSGRKANSGDDEEFLEEVPSLRGRTKGKAGRRKKRGAAGSDSDNCSDPSDCEFTISEEEREQIREANLICRTVATNLRSSRKNQEDEAFCEPKKPPVRKGKEKAEEIKNDLGKPVCGICLTEEGRSTVRGTLNCCTHYFCFACIMEWSKVETRCPLCKQRFVTISKPTKCGKGSDLRNAVVTVPERDQVYQPSEEELRDFLNPYENVICTECHQGGDDALMLLCDVCDSPAHTYCVGLGQEVPEGNWYCDGCRPAALASLHPQAHDLIPDQRAANGASDGRSTFENMAEIDLNVTIPETPLSQGDGFLTSPRFPGGSRQVPSPVSGIGVSTVSGRRRIHRQIQHILSRRSQTGGEIRSLGNIIGLGVDPTFHHSRTDVGTSHHVQQVGRFQDLYPHSVQNMDFGPGRLEGILGHVGQPFTAAIESAHGPRAWSGLNSINLGAAQAHLPDNDPLRPCTSRSSSQAGVGGFSSQNREEEHSNNFVKQEVHTIVRNQIKEISRDMNLDQNSLVEIFRRSVHTVMAACGLEPQRHDTFIMPPPGCVHHLDRFANVQSSPLNGCCLVCFQEFVQVVVKRMMDILTTPHWQDYRH